MNSFLSKLSQISSLNTPTSMNTTNGGGLMDYANNNGGLSKFA